jgi:hypothetical protein
VAVGPDISYTVLEKDGGRYILARDRQAAGAGDGGKRRPRDGLNLLMDLGTAPRTSGSWSAIGPGSSAHHSTRSWPVPVSRR